MCCVGTVSSTRFPFKSTTCELCQPNHAGLHVFPSTSLRSRHAPAPSFPWSCLTLPPQPESSLATPFPPLFQPPSLKTISAALGSHLRGLRSTPARPRKISHRVDSHTRLIFRQS